GLAALALTGCSLLGGDEPVRDDETGEITEAAEASVFTIKVGDCINTAELGTSIETVPTVPCGDPHDSEVYATTELPEGDYPADIGTQADDFCVGEFEAFVGLAYEESELFIQSMYPDPTGWTASDDREILCSVVSEELVT